jgi:hypothetical protein
MENRKGSVGRSSELPADYLKMVSEVFNTNFDLGLKEITKLTGSKAWFEASGSIYPDEIILCLSILQEDKIAATSVYASCDFDPKASSPTLEDLLAACVDALGTLCGELLDPTKSEQISRISEDSLSSLENVPFHWTPFDVNRRKVFLKIDKANPNLDQAADQWLAQHDPHFKEQQEQEEKETEELFFTGPKDKKVH